jgi:heme a synthase
VQILLGAFVAGSRHHGMSTTWPDFNGAWAPSLWQANETLAVNLLDNPGLHQFAHRWFAAVVLAAVLALAIAARRQPIGQRCRLALNMGVSSLLAQVVLGLMNVWHAAPVLIALGHLLTAIVMVCALVVVLVDLHGEPDDAGDATPSRVLGGVC